MLNIKAGGAQFGGDEVRFLFTDTLTGTLLWSLTELQRLLKPNLRDF